MISISEALCTNGVGSQATACWADVEFWVGIPESAYECIAIEVITKAMDAVRKAVGKESVVELFHQWTDEVTSFFSDKYLVLKAKSGVVNVLVVARVIVEAVECRLVKIRMSFRMG